MKLLDKIALNRLISIITSFVLAVLKILNKSNESKLPNKRILPWRNKNES